jgi:hypothetical protein
MARIGSKMGIDYYQIKGVFIRMWDFATTPLRMLTSKVLPQKAMKSGGSKRQRKKIARK